MTGQTKTDANPGADTSGSILAAENLRGSMLMVISMIGFGLNDVLIKLVGQALNLGQVMLIRGMMASCLVFGLAWFLGHLRPARTILCKPMIMRAIGEVIATVSFLTALFNMPIANATAILQALPLAVTLAAALFLSEKIGWRRLSATFVGLFGVLLIIRPGLEGFSQYSLYVLVAIGGCVLRDLSTRGIPKDIPTLFITLTTAVSIMLVGGLISLFQPFKTVTPNHLWLLGGSAIFLMIGYYFVTAAMRVGEVGFIAPFRYAILPVSVVAGIFVFDEIPDLMTLIGASIIVATGIYTLYRERRVRHEDLTQVPNR